MSPESKHDKQQGIHTEQKPTESTKKTGVGDHEPSTSGNNPRDTNGRQGLGGPDDHVSGTDKQG